MSEIASTHVLNLSDTFLSRLDAQDYLLDNSPFQLEILDLSSENGAGLLRGQGLNELHERNSTWMSNAELTYDEWEYHIDPNSNRGLSIVGLKTPQ